MDTYVGDTPKIVLETGIDLSGYPDRRIKFKRPNGTVGFWIAFVDPLYPTRMYRQLIYSDLNIAGIWIIQAVARNPLLPPPPNVRLNGSWVELKVGTAIADTTSPPTTAGPTTAPPF